MLRVEGLFHISAYVDPIFISPFVEETLLSAEIDFTYFVKDLLNVDMKINFWSTYSDPLVRVSIFVPVTGYIDYELSCSMS